VFAGYSARIKYFYVKIQVADLDEKFAFSLRISLPESRAEVSSKSVSEIIGVRKLELSRIAEQASIEGSYGFW